MKTYALAAAALATLSAAVVSAAPTVDMWEIGPTIRGRNYSVNMPLAPEATRAGPSFAFPGPTADDGHVHYLTIPTRPLAGARRIVLTYRIDAVPGTRFVPQEDPAMSATLSLYFQRAGDRWGTRQAAWRWYAPHARVVELAPGTRTVSVSLGEEWINVNGQNASTDREGFAEALADTARVGFVFGSRNARGHGVYATRPARFTIVDFRVE